jgi:hypothetical protein
MVGTVKAGADYAIIDDRYWDETSLGPYFQQQGRRFLPDIRALV